MIVDAHVHLFPTEIRERRERFCSLDQNFASIYRSPRAPMASLGDLLEALDEAEVDKAVVFGFPWSDPQICKDHNDYTAEACTGSKGRLVGLGCVSPSMRDEGVREAERCLEKGLQGIGELAAYAPGRIGLDGLFFRDLATLLERWRRPLLLHATESVGHSYPGKDCTDLGTLYRWIRKHPELDIILAHWGGGLFFYELMPEVQEACRRVRYDTAASPFLYRPEVYRIALQIVGRDRILFGSDFPLIHPRRYLREIGGQALPGGDSMSLLGGNALRLWQWGERT